MPLHLSIIIVNYHTPDFCNQCIASVKKNTHHLNYEIIIVDNSSSESDKKAVLHQHPDIKWYDMGYNAGFARANNYGINQSQGEYILLLNSDTEVYPNTINDIFFYLKEKSNVVACGCQLLNPDKTNQFSCDNFEYGYRWLFYVPYWWDFTKPIHKYFQKDTSNFSKNQTEWLIGAFIMVKKSAIDKVGLMDEDFFLYAEEIEWCYRLGKIGELHILRDIKTLHYMGASSEKEYQQHHSQINISDKRERQRLLSVLVWLRKQYGVLFYIFALLNFTFGGFYYLLRTILDKKETKPPLNFLKNVWVWYKFAPYLIFNIKKFYKTY